MHRTLVSLANALQVSTGTLSRWRSQWAGFPKKKRGGWDAEEVRAWHTEAVRERADRKRANNSKTRLKQTRTGRPHGPDPEIAPFEDVEPLRVADEEAKWRAAYRKAKAEREMLELQKARGEVVDRGEVEDMFSSRVHEITARLDAMGRTLAPQLEGLTAREIEARINEHSRGIRIHFARATPIADIGQSKPRRR